MFFRQRGINISLERPVYVPAVKTPDGTAVLTPAKRTTQYLGSIKSWWTMERVPQELLTKLTTEERSALEARLKQNVIPPTNWMAELPRVMRLAAQQMGQRAAELKAEGKDPRKSELFTQMAEISQAGWELLRAAQESGVRRKLVRKPKTTPAEASTKTTSKWSRPAKGAGKRVRQGSRTARTR